MLLMMGDVFAAEISVVVALDLWALHASTPFGVSFVLAHWYWFVALPVLWLVLASAYDYYDLRVAARARQSLVRLALIAAQTLAIYFIIFFLSPRGALPRRFVVYYAVISLLLIGIWRACRLFLIGWTGFRRRALIVGVGGPADAMWRVLKDQAHGDYHVVGRVVSHRDLATVAHVPDVLGTGDDLPELVRQFEVSELVMAYLNEVPDDVFTGVMTCYEQGAEVVPVTTLYEEITGRVLVEHVEAHLWTLVLPPETHSFTHAAYLAIKRILDVLFALAGLSVFALLLPFLSLLIKSDSPGPVFYRQQRLGKGGRSFIVLKLRSMVADAEGDSGPQWATQGDGRVTRVGRFLRKTRFDELPQLTNVLRGDMSIVGPRPERPEFVALLSQEIPFYRTRLAVKPGLTGWAQVRYPYGSSVQDALHKLQYDLYYIRHQTLALDIRIILRTVGTVLLLRGT